MEQDKITRQVLRQMNVGETQTFNVQEPTRVAQARVTCSQMKTEEGLEFSVKRIHENVAITITRVK